MTDVAAGLRPSPAPLVMRTPRHVDIDLTSRCNLRCRYCYFFDNTAVPYGEVPTEEWLQFFGELGRCQVMEVCLAGGEPFMRDDLPQLLEGLVENRMRYMILSNGTLITDEMAAFIASTRRCSYVQVSIDSYNPESHDACRGKGVWERAMRGLHALQRHKVRCTVRVTLHRHNVHDIEETARFLLEEVGLSSFGVNSVGYLGSCRVHADDVMLTIDERMEAMEALVRATKTYPDRIQSAAGPLTDARMWREMEKARLEGAPPFARGGRLAACGCYNSKINVRCDGVLTPCNMLTHIELGRINQVDLVDVWRNNPLLNELRRRTNIPLTQFEWCAGCEYIPYCTGNCPALAYTLTGQVNHPSPDACLRKYLQDGGRLLAEE